MMRWLFALLLLANLAFFAFMRWGAAWLDDGGNMQPQQALNADKIRLQPASAVVALQAQLSSAVQSAVPVAASAPIPVTCVEWGEFSGSDLARVSAALAELNLGDRLTQKQIEHVSGYWVYIPPLKNRAEADKKVGQLKARGVEEYFIIKDAGKWQNAISLGIFKTEEAAQKFLATLTAKGVVSARAGERMSKLSFTVFELKNLDGATADKVRALQNQFPGSEMKTVACAG